MSEKIRKADDIPLAIESRIKWFVNNQRFADVTFAVGEEKEIVYAHRSILASGSPVFERMFFANYGLQMTKLGPMETDFGNDFFGNHIIQMTRAEPIEIPDLTAVGFINMLKYIYTNELKDLELLELFETFIAGDKYQVYNMNESMFSIINDALNESNCCIIYDQLLKIPSQYVCVLIDQVRAMIRYNSELAFKNEHFVNISLETLVDLLSMDSLIIDEIDVLKFCAEWVDVETERLNLEPNATNKQEIFKPMKNLIRFSKITLDQLKNFSTIRDLLSNDELGSLLLHHLNMSQCTIGCNIARNKLTLRSSLCQKLYGKNNFYYKSYQNFSEFILEFKASGDIFIRKIYSFLATKIEDLELSINDDGINVELNYEKLSEEDNCWHFRFIDPVKVDATKKYKFVFKFRSSAIYYNTLSRDTAMITSGSSLQCNLSSLTNWYHCLKRIDFYELS